jgi:uncharacterized RDD family membrane protein YckC
MADQQTPRFDVHEGQQAASSPNDADPGQAAPEPSAGQAKADLTKRFIAGVIDAVIAVLIGLIPIIGGLIAAAYWLVRDGLELDFMDGRSVGKRLVKLRPVRLDGSKMDIQTSIRRNWMFALGGVVQLLLFIPILGWLLVIPVGLAALGLGIVEIVLVLTDAEGRRLGDKMAETRVVEVDA